MDEEQRYEDHEVRFGKEVQRGKKRSHEVFFRFFCWSSFSARKLFFLRSPMPSLDIAYRSKPCSM